MSGLTVSVSGSPVEFSGAGPVMQGESVLVPFRAVLEKLGSTVAYDSASKRIDAATSKYKVRLTPGSTAARVNDRDINMSVAPKLIGGTVYIPLRFVSESLGAKVQYDATAKTVQITPGPETSATGTVGSGTDTGTQAMNETNTTTNQTPANVGNTPVNSPDAGNAMGNAGTNAGTMSGNTDSNTTNTTSNAPDGMNGANTGENAANMASAGNTADVNATADTAPVTPTPRSTTVTTVPATSESVETPSSIPWLPILGVLAALIIAAIVYFALKGRRSGQIIASGSDNKKN